MAFTVTALVLVLHLFAAALGVAVSQERLVERLRASAPAVKHWGGYVLMLVGVWFVILGTFAGTFARIFPV
ncbi:MAG: hypothetical protein KY469_06725 [Actinobacteria bacterium]|nr:hypothetical protein [Actinomycetota bacterium]